MVDVKLVRRFCPPIPRSRLKFRPALDGMELLKPGSRLSVQPVEAEAFRDIVEFADTLAAGSGAGARQSAPGRDSVEFADTLAAGSEKEKTFTAASRKKEDAFTAGSRKKGDTFSADSGKKEDAFVAGSRKKEDTFSAGSEKKENMFADGWEKKND